MNKINLRNKNCLVVSGDITFYTISALNQDVVLFLLDHPSISEVDLSLVKKSDSAALLLLLSLWRQAQKKNLNLRFINLPPQLTRLVTLSNLEKVLGL